MSMSDLKCKDENDWLGVCACRARAKEVEINFTFLNIFYIILKSIVKIAKPAKFCFL